jgi:dolichol-phosphate mannosyltransferase
MLSVVIAAHDERENLEELIRRLHAALPSACEESELVLVLAGADGSRELVESLASTLGIDRLKVLHQETPSGLGNAFRSGFDAVSPEAELVATMDADLNHQPEELPRLVRRLATAQADVVVGSRFTRESRVEGTPLWKRVLSGCMNVVLMHLFGLATRDKTSGYRVYRADALRRIRFANADFAFLPEMLIDASQQGMRIVEEPIHFIHRTRGTSKMRIVKTSMSYLGLLRTRRASALLLHGAGVARGTAQREPGR